MKFKLFSSIIVLAGLTFSQAGAQTVRVEFQSSYPKDHIVSQALTRFAEEVNGKVDARLRVRYGEPYGEIYTYSEAIAKGERNMGGGLYFPEMDKRFNIILMGGLAANWEEAAKIYGSDGKMLDLWNRIGANHDLMMLAAFPAGFGGIVFRGDAPDSLPVKQKIRTRVPPYASFDAAYRALGFETIVMPHGEIYTAMQTGVLDARAASPAPQAYMGYRDVAKSFMYTRDYFEILVGILVNKTWFEGLPADVQHAMRQAADHAAQWSWTVAQAQETEYLEKFRNEGVRVVAFSEEEYVGIRDMIREVQWSVLRAEVGDEVMDEIESMAAAVGTR